MTKALVSVLLIFLMSSALPAQTPSPSPAPSGTTPPPSAAPMPGEKSKSAAPAPATAAQIAAAPAEVDPQATAILDRYVAAIGGKDAWAKYSSRVSKGTIEIPAMSMTGVIEVSEKAPNKMRSVVSIGDTPFQQGFDGTVGWADDPQNGPRLLQGRELEELKRDAEFARPINLRTLYSQIKFIGKEKLGDRDVQVVEVSSPQTGSEKMYFDSKSALLLRVVANRAGPDGNGTVESILDDYAVVDGMTLPMTVHQTAGSTSYVVHLVSVKHGVDIPDSTFTAPESAN
jgi:zinc protease